MHGLDWYDYGARQYDAAGVPVFTTIDPMAEKYYHLSPYAYCANNPVKYIDPDGEKIVIGTFWQRLQEKIFGWNSYIDKVKWHLQQNNMDSQRINGVYNLLENSEHVYRILPVTESPYYNTKGFQEKTPNTQNHTVSERKAELGKTQGGTIYYDPDNNTRAGGFTAPARIGLAHEMGHLENFATGKARHIDKNRNDKVELYKKELNEQNSLELENEIRDILNYPKREYYYEEFKNE